MEVSTLRKLLWNERPVYDWDMIRDYFGKGLLLNRRIQFSLMRHAQTFNNSNNLVTGSLDISLTEKGKEEAREASQKLESWYDVFVSSNMSRTIETLSIATCQRGCKASTWIQDPRINERSFGNLEGKSKKKLPKETKQDLDFCPDCGESYRYFSQRILSSLIDVIDFCPKEKSVAILVCCHMGTLRILYGTFKNLVGAKSVLNLQFKNTEILRFSPTELYYPDFLETP